jgi:hypothetical protein
VLRAAEAMVEVTDRSSLFLNLANALARRHARSADPTDLDMAPVLPRWRPVRCRRGIRRSLRKLSLLAPFALPTTAVRNTPGPARAGRPELLDALVDKTAAAEAANEVIIDQSEVRDRLRNLPAGMRSSMLKDALVGARCDPPVPRTRPSTTSPTSASPRAPANRPDGRCAGPPTATLLPGPTATGSARPPDDGRRVISDQGATQQLCREHVVRLASGHSSEDCGSNVGAGTKSPSLPRPARQVGAGHPPPTGIRPPYPSAVPAASWTTCVVASRKLDAPTEAAQSGAPGHRPSHPGVPPLRPRRGPVDWAAEPVRRVGHDSADDGRRRRGPGAPGAAEHGAVP